MNITYHSYLHRQEFTDEITKETPKYYITSYGIAFRKSTGWGTGKNNYDYIVEVVKDDQVIDYKDINFMR